jgi:uncharacterized protein (DUF2249 family)
MPFSTNLAGEFQWEYEQEGPVDWIVKIKRKKNGLKWENSKIQDQILF